MEIYYEAEEEDFPYILLAPSLDIFEFSGTATTPHADFMYTQVQAWLESRYKHIHPHASITFKIEKYNQTNLNQLVVLLEVIKKAKWAKVVWYQYPNAWERKGIPAQLKDFSSEFIEIRKPQISATQEKIDTLIATKNHANELLAFQLLEGLNIPKEPYIYKVMVNSDFDSGKGACFEGAYFKILEHISGKDTIALPDTGISFIPPQIGKHWNLKKLNLASNPIQSIPKEIGQLKKLEYLDLSHTSVYELPPETNQLTQLKELYLEGTNIKGISETIQQLPRLQSLSISTAQAKRLNRANFSQIEHLERLYVAQSDFHLLPVEIRALQKVGFLRPFHIFPRYDDLPTIVLDAQKGIFKLSGRIYPEDGAEFFQPVFDWLRLYIQHPNQITHFIFNIESLGTSVSKYFLDIMEILEHTEGAGIHWYYHEDDEDMEEAGEEYSELVDMPFEFFAYEGTFPG